MQVRYQLRHRPRPLRVLHLVWWLLPERLLQGDHRTVPPQPLELIETALIVVEDVNDEFAEIEENPPALGFPLPSNELVSGEVQIIFDAVGNRLGISLTSTGHDEENVGNGQTVGHIERHGVAGTLSPPRLPGTLTLVECFV